MNKTLLILSGDEALKRNYTKALLQSGFKVADASDIMDALLIANKHTIDAIIIDENVDDKGDYPDYSRIRKYSRAPIILLGAKPVSEVSNEGSGNGYNAYFEKSDNLTELITYIEHIVTKTEPVGKKTETPVAESPAVKPPAKVETSPHSEPVFSIVANLEHQVAKMKALMSALYQIQETISEAEFIINERQQALDTVVNKLHEAKKHINDITGNSDKADS